MVSKQTNRNCAEGRLPAMAPLANAYVPFQLEDAPRYEARKGLVRGTLFPGLDLPFMGMINKNELPVSPMSELQVINFAIQELTLYLDTHREDKEALALLRNYQQMYEKCAEQFAHKRGPLNIQQHSHAERHDWLDDPWPWEFCANKEV